MITTREIQDEIIRLKKENDICILAHAYQNHNILEVADYTGDSYGLSVQATKSKAKTVLMCGVRFMAETVKILSPDKKVILSNSDVIFCSFSFVKYKVSPLVNDINVSNMNMSKDTVVIEIILCCFPSFKYILQNFSMFSSYINP